MSGFIQITVFSQQSYIYVLNVNKQTRMMPGGSRVLVLSIVFVLFGGKYECRSQEVDNQLWINYALSAPINAHLTLGGDVGVRGLVSNEDWNQLLFRPTLTYRFNQTWGVSVAVANFSTLNKDETNTYEFRTIQDLNLYWPNFSFISFLSRVRIEQRWFYYEDLPNDFKVRVRYQLGARSPDFLLFGGKKPFYVQGSWEGFRTLANESAVEVFIDRSRIDLSFGHRVSASFRYEIHYISQRSRQFTDSGLEVTQNIFRLRLFHRLQRKDESG
jgi:hypothetical protein